MSVKFTVRQSTLKDKKGRKNFYPVLVQNGVTSTRDLAEMIAGRSSLTRGDVRNVIDNLADVMNIQLRNGLTLHLEGFGYFRLGLIKSQSAENAEDVRPDSKFLTIRFAPEQDRHSDGKLRTRAMVADNVDFERVYKKEPEKKPQAGAQGGETSQGNDL
ncbi:MAG: HU family DNA-binding protein [Bacteroides sp.]|nr:HU family DNA-binding protein [Bacteroides sp.]